MKVLTAGVKKQDKPCPGRPAAEPVSSFPQKKRCRALQAHCFSPVYLAVRLPQLQWCSWDTTDALDTLRRHRRGERHTWKE